MIEITAHIQRIHPKPRHSFQAKVGHFQLPIHSR